MGSKKESLVLTKDIFAASGERANSTLCSPSFLGPSAFGASDSILILWAALYGEDCTPFGCGD